MGVAVLHPQDCLKDPFYRDVLTPPHMKYPRNPYPNRPKRPQPNRRRRSPPPAKTNSTPAPPPPPLARAATKVSNKKNNHLVIGQVRILKRGEEIAKTTPDLESEEPDLGSTRRIGPDPEKVPINFRVADPKRSPIAFYAGPVTLTSPQPSELPLPLFFKKKSVSVFINDAATSGLKRILRLDVP